MGTTLAALDTAEFERAIPCGHWYHSACLAKLEHDEECLLCPGQAILQWQSPHFRLTLGR